MSENIPGGRQRSSSDGDILEEGISCGFKSSKSSGNVKEVSNSNNNRQPGRLRVFTKHRNKTNTLPLPTALSNHAECDENVFDSDGGISSQGSLGSNKSKKRSRKLSFKSMRKAVSRAFVKEGKGTTGEQNVKGNNFTVEVNDSGKIWTPDLRHLGKGQSNMYDTDSPRSILSSARPLITDPDLGMSIPKWKKTPGTIGICNHANSCFMNAVLQCLSNTDSFTEYFVQEFHKHDLKLSKNVKKSTFRSSHGEVTEQLGQLLSSLWCGKYQSDVSKAFKAAVAKVNNQYQGDDQHDAQEFLLWLLDRIHEDVCIPLKKKAKNQKSSSSKSDEELAQEALSVNGESFVVKLFKALHSSTLTCPSCGDRSRTFDPYLCVSLPLPQKSPRLMYINIVFLEPHRGDRCIKIALVVNHFDTVLELRESVSNEAGIPVSQIILCQLTKEGFGATYSNEQPLSDISDNDIVYALEAHSDGRGVGGDNSQADNQFDSPNAQVFVIHVEKADKSSHSRRFGSPSVIQVSRDIRWKDLQKEMLYQLDDAVCQEIFSQRLSNLFMMQVWDGSSHNGHLSMDVEMPLYTQAAERALDTLSQDFGPLHIKILAIWSPQTKNKVIIDDRERISEHSSVRDLSSNPPSLDTVSLYECFKLYTQEEKLIGEDAWMCPHCKQLQQGTVKSLGLWSLPDILILHLKRFKQTGRSKLDTLVEFPIDDFDMSPHLSPCNKSTSHMKSDNSTYDLVGVCNHYGNMMGGHYTAFCRSPVDGKWREFNDAKVREVDGPVATKEAYLLFYQRRSLSKDINQKLFTGDHWVFSLSQQEGKESSTSPDTSPRDEKENVQSSFRAHKTRSRSTSPSLRRRQSGSPTKRVVLQPSTPQPKRRPAVLSYYDNNDEDDDEDQENEYNRADDFEDEIVPSTKSSPEKLLHPPQPQQHTVRQSRPLQRQLSSPGDVARRMKSSGKSPSRGVYERRNDAEDAAYAPSKMSPKPLSYLDSSSSTGDKSKSHLVVSVVKHSAKDIGINSSSSSSGLKYRNDNRNGFHYVGSATTTTTSSIPLSSTLSSHKNALDNYGLRSNGLHDETRLDSGAKYPSSLSSSSNIPSCHSNSSDKYSNKEFRSGQSSSHSDVHNSRYIKDNNSEFVSGLQVDLDPLNSRHNHSSSSQVSKSYDFESTLPSSSSGEARRRLAEHIKQNSLEKENGLEYSSTITRPTANTVSRRYQSQNSYDLAKRNQVDFNTLLDSSGRNYHSHLTYDLAKRSPLDLAHLSMMDDEEAALSDLDIRGHDLHDDSIPPPRSHRPEDYRGNKDRQSYPPRLGDEDYLLYSNGSYLDSSLHSRLKDDDLRQLAQRHFGEPDSGVSSYRDPPMSTDSSKSSTLYHKYATIARSREISPSHHYLPHHNDNHSRPYHHLYHDNDSSDLLISSSSPPSSSSSMSVPRSITDQNINYNNYHNPSDLPTLLEEHSRSFDARRDSPSITGATSTSSSTARLTEREINLIRSYDMASRRVPNSVTGTRLTSSYGTRRFMRPRGWNVTPVKTTKVPTSKVPAPCLRESSV